MSLWDKRSLAPASGGSKRWIAPAAVVVGVVLVTLTRLWLVSHLSDQGWFAKYPAIASDLWSGTGAQDRIGDLSTGYLALVTLLMGAGGLGPHALRAVQIIAVSMAARKP